MKPRSMSRSEFGMQVRKMSKGEFLEAQFVPRTVKQSSRTEHSSKVLS